MRWQDTEAIDRDEDWVESNFGVDEVGHDLFLDVRGRAQIDFADVTFDNGEVQSIDLNEQVMGNGARRLLDFPGRRKVRAVQLVARSKGNEAGFRLYLSG